MRIYSIIQYGRIWLLLILLLASYGCGNGSGEVLPKTDSIKVVQSETRVIPEAGKKHIPVLCYHQVRDWVKTDSKKNRVYIMPVAGFKEQMKMLRDSGYHTILPDQLAAYLENRISLPPKSILLTFDDADESQYATALPELDKYGFKGVFFIMTVVLGHRHYMSKEQVKGLAGHGHIIGCHTWNHEIVTRYKDGDWEKQIVKPRSELEKITGLPVKYFAYPDGLWNMEAVEKLKQYGFAAAFRLAGKTNKQEPLYTIGRIIVGGQWDLARFAGALKTNYQ